MRTKPIKPSTVLVVDDFEEMRSTLRLWLEGHGYQVVEAADGEQALEVTRAEHPDLILMDVGLPQRSGISATYRIRKDPEFLDVPVLAISAYDTPDLQEDAFKAGCVEYLTKPVDTERLERLLSRLLGTRAQANVH